MQDTGLCTYDTILLSNGILLLWTDEEEEKGAKRCIIGESRSDWAGEKANVIVNEAEGSDGVTEVLVLVDRVLARLVWLSVCSPGIWCQYR